MITGKYVHFCLLQELSFMITADFFIYLFLQKTDKNSPFDELNLTFGSYEDHQ